MPLSTEVEEMADRIRRLTADRPEVTEKHMFGTIAFFLNGNMLLGPTKNGGLMARVGEDYFDTAISLPGTSPMIMGARQMKGYVEVSRDVIETGDQLNSWIAQAEQFVQTLPPK